MKRILPAILAFVLLSLATARAALQLHLPLNDNAASATVVAAVGSNQTLSGGHNTSTLHNTGPVDLGYGFTFDGSSDYISVGSPPTFSGGDTFSISVWFYCPTSITSRAILGSNSGSHGNRLYLFNTTTLHLYGSTGDTSAVQFLVPFTITADAWHHLHLTRVGTTASMWIDGIPTTAVGPSSDGFTPQYIARDNATYSAIRLADLRIYNSDEGANGEQIRSLAYTTTPFIFNHGQTGWTIPTGYAVTLIEGVGCGGGGAGNGAGATAGGGGAGGAYATKAGSWTGTLDIVCNSTGGAAGAAGNHAGTAGDAATVSQSAVTLLSAPGGAPGSPSASANTDGVKGSGSTSGYVGDSAFAGGNGANGAWNGYAGSGGGGADSTGAGNAATYNVASGGGAAKGVLGGLGAYGLNSNAAPTTIGGIAGGGGAGGQSQFGVDRAGSAGGGAKVRVTLSVVTAKPELWYFYLHSSLRRDHRKSILSPQFDPQFALAP